MHYLYFICALIDALTSIHLVTLNVFSILKSEWLEKGYYII